MFNKLTAPKLFMLTAATVLVTVFLMWLVIVFEPPAFFGYFFGLINGANWILLLVLYVRYWEEKI